VRKTLAVYRKELRQIRRDRRTLFILVFVPALFLLLYGYALNWDIRHVALAVQDRDDTAESRSLVSAFVNSSYFDRVADAYTPADLDRLLETNDARAALVIPEGFARDLANRRSPEVQVIINGDNANTATTVMGYASAIIRGAGATLAPGSTPLAAPVSLEPRIWYNPELRSTLFLVPGLIAYILMITAVISTALSIVREKQFGTMEQVRMAPVRTFEYVVGKSIPYFLVSLASAAMIVFASMLLGSWLSLLFAVSLFIAGALGMGLLISTIADSQDVAFQVAMLSSFLPTLILSGFIFPISSMPQALQVITYAVPARYFLVALRGILLKGTSIWLLLPEMGALVAFAAVMLGLASLRLAKEWR
jgi:ABC-2 type transport system permease protein